MRVRAVMPCVTALIRDFAFPCSVFGPVLSFELRLLASICAAVAMGVKSQGGRKGNHERPETHEKTIDVISPGHVLSLLMIRPAHGLSCGNPQFFWKFFFDGVGGEAPSGRVGRAEGEAHRYAEDRAHGKTSRRKAIRGFYCCRRFTTNSASSRRPGWHRKSRGRRSTPRPWITRRS